MTYDDLTTVQDALAMWDRGEPIWSVEMGGIGPGYEQAIQVLIVEIMRDELDKPLPEPGAANGWADATISRLDKEFGFSGAQVGAARSVAYQFLRYGYGKHLGNAKKQGIEDRLILVNKNFPVLPVSP